VASRYKRWDTIVAQGQPFDQIMMLEEGQCLEYDGCAADLQSKEFSSARCVEHMYSGDMFGTDRTIGKKGVMAPFTLVAITDCTVLRIPNKFLLGTTALPRACYSPMPDKAAPASARKSRSGSEEKEGSPRKGGSEKMDKPEKEKRKSRIAIQREDIEMDDDSGTKKEPADEKSAPTGRRRTKDGSSEEELSPRTGGVRVSLLAVNEAEDEPEEETLRSPSPASSASTADDLANFRIKSPMISPDARVVVRDAQAGIAYCNKGHVLAALGTTRDNGWSCSGALELGGCKGGHAGFGETLGVNRFRCEECDYDLCVKCKFAKAQGSA